MSQRHVWLATRLVAQQRRRVRKADDPADRERSARLLEQFEVALRHYKQHLAEQLGYSAMWHGGRRVTFVAKAERRRRRHYAFAVEPADGGFRVSHVVEYASRRQADQAMLAMTERYGDADAITLERELLDDEVLALELLKRPAPTPPRASRAKITSMAAQLPISAPSVL